MRSRAAAIFASATRKCSSSLFRSINCNSNFTAVMLSWNPLFGALRRTFDAVQSLANRSQQMRRYTGLLQVRTFFVAFRHHSVRVTAQNDEWDLLIGQ